MNAVLRRIARGERGAPPVDVDDVDTLARVASHPAWLVRRWLGRRPRAEVDAWLAFNNTTAPLTLRVNPLVAGSCAEVAEALARYGVVTTPCRHAPLGLMVQDGNPLGTPPMNSGACGLQDEGSQLAALVAPVHAGARVLDVCASPGGKTLAYLAAAGADGYVVAADVRTRRVQLLADTLTRAHATRVGIVHIDADAALPVRGGFDVVAVDAPCSGLGTLRRDPDIKWRRTPDDLPRLAARQLDLLQRASAAVRPGGTLVYTTCSSEAEENEEVVATFLGLTPEFALGRADRGPHAALLAPYCDAAGRFSTDPARHGLEAYFGAVLVREGGGPARAGVVQ